MSLRTSYSLLAPFYDVVAQPLFTGARRASLARLRTDARREVLLDGVGTGLDLPHLPPIHRYTALDLTRAMLARAVRRAGALDVSWVEGDSLRLPFRDASFDYVVLHLILAVVPDGAGALREALRVVRRGGELLILDKFLARGTHAPLRRLASPLLGSLVTRTDVVFEDLLDATAGAAVTEDAPALAGGWFRAITVKRVV